MLQKRMLLSLLLGLIFFNGPWLSAQTLDGSANNQFSLNWPVRRGPTIVESLEQFAQSTIPPIVHEAKTKGWSSDLILHVFEGRVKQSIEAYAGTVEFETITPQLDDLIANLRTNVGQVPIESARRVLLVAPDGLLLNQIRSALTYSAYLHNTESAATGSAIADTDFTHSSHEALPPATAARRPAPPVEYANSAIPARREPRSARPPARAIVHTDSAEPPRREPSPVGARWHPSPRDQFEGSARQTAWASDRPPAGSSGQEYRTRRQSGSIRAVQHKTALLLPHGQQSSGSVNDTRQSPDVHLDPVPDNQFDMRHSPSSAVPSPPSIYNSESSQIPRPSPDYISESHSPSPNAFSTDLGNAGSGDPSIEGIHQKNSQWQPQSAIYESMYEPMEESSRYFQNPFPFLDSLKKYSLKDSLKDSLRPFIRNPFPILDQPEWFPLVDGQTLKSEFHDRTASYPQDREEAHPQEQTDFPDDYSPWWHDAVIGDSIEAGKTATPVRLEDLALASIQFSPQIAALKVEPLVRETRMIEEDAEFDWNAFIENSYDHLDEPWLWNSALLPGGPGGLPGAVGGANGTRLQGDQLKTRIGMKRLLAKGAELEFAQQFDYLSNNQNFLVPNPATTARFELNIKKPLLRGRGKAVNQSRFLIAEINRDISVHELAADMQNHLSDVHGAYWRLYQARATLVQKRESLAEGERILEIINARQAVDATQGQVMRTRSVVAKRRSEIPQAKAAIKDAESELRLLVNSPQIESNLKLELLPIDAPMSSGVDVSLQGSLQTALTNRPDIAAAIKNIHSTSIRLEVSKNDLLPRFDLHLGMYVAGLKTGSRSPLADQMAQGPGYNAALIFEVPLGNRAAQAARDRKEFELTKAFKEFELTVDAGLTETERAVRDLQTAHKEMLARYDAMTTASAESTFALTRWQTVTADGSSMYLVDALFAAQDRTTQEEVKFVESQVAYEIAVVELKRVVGILLAGNTGPRLPSTPMD